MGYQPRFCVVSSGILRLYSGGRWGRLPWAGTCGGCLPGQQQAAAASSVDSAAAAGYDELVGCGGWVRLRGNCTALDISDATAGPSLTKQGLPRIILHDGPPQAAAHDGAVHDGPVSRVQQGDGPDLDEGDAGGGEANTRRGREGGEASGGGRVRRGPAWKLSICCANTTSRAAVLAALERAGCRVVTRSPPAL